MQLAYEELRKTDAWKLLERRLEELEVRFSQRLGNELIRGTKAQTGAGRPTDGVTLSDKRSMQDQMLESFVNVAYHRGVLRGMSLIVKEPERVSRDFEAAFRERIA